MLTITRPTTEEYASFFANYVSLVGEGDVLEQLAAQFDLLHSMLAPLDDETASRGYAPGKWSVKEALGHMLDMERLFCFRALAFAREPGLDLPGCDQDLWAEGSGYNQRSMADLLADFAAVRRATLTLFAGFNEEQLGRAGTVEGHVLTVRAIPYITVGHEMHHIGVFRERYLS